MLLRNILMIIIVYRNTFHFTFIINVHKRKGKKISEGKTGSNEDKSR